MLFKRRALIEDPATSCAVKKFVLEFTVALRMSRNTRCREDGVLERRYEFREHGGIDVRSTVRRIFRRKAYRLPGNPLIKVQRRTCAVTN